MNWNTFIGVAASVSFLLPVAVIVYHKLYRHRSLAALSVTYLTTSIYILMSEGFIDAPLPFIRYFGMANNYMDVPLMLTALLFFCPIRQNQRGVHIVTGLFIAYEIIIAIVFGMNRNAIIYVMGPGMGIVMIYTFYLFIRHIKITIEHGKNAGRTLMLASILFAYGCYSFVYLFYYVMDTPFIADAMLLYYIASFVGAVLMTIGLHMIRKRVQELQELRNTRRELALFFNH